MGECLKVTWGRGGGAILISPWRLSPLTTTVWIERWLGEGAWQWWVECECRVRR